MKIETGDPVVLVDDTGLGEMELEKGQKGWANSVTTIPGNGTYVFFMPEDSKEMFVIGAKRLKVDKEAKERGVTLDQYTLPKS